SYGEAVVNGTRVIADDDVVVERQLDRIDVGANDPYPSTILQVRKRSLCMMELDCQIGTLFQQLRDDIGLVRQITVRWHVQNSRLPRSGHRQPRFVLA